MKNRRGYHRTLVAEPGGNPLRQLRGRLLVEGEHQDLSGLGDAAANGVTGPATIVDVFPDPADAIARTRLSKQIAARTCSSVSGDFSTVS